MAKPKGIRWEYSRIDELQPVIALNGDLESVLSGKKKWKAIYVEQQELMRP
ncbi:hypothetical protein EST38_g5574 [Candolleomyces aberdarensis]|uniref:Uncharacterized protein n=1 Tax=Candolleomyces aberdarensis TaxID=2316362 RepID=A0A4Q2DM52_9AGAR|nr:hypothetical protein EST38_g5574 [Candolleomyces aberdarensis]